MKLLAGDLGGTKTHLAIVEKHSGQYQLLHEQRYSSAQYPHLRNILHDFLQEMQIKPQELHAACIGVAGPVESFADHQQSKITNLPWDVDSRDLQTHTGIAKIKLINDFQLIGYGIDALQPEELVTLLPGVSEAKGNRVFLGAGTGLGTGFGVWNDAVNAHQVLASEGGHMDFAPCNEKQRALLAYLAAKHSHIPYEYLLSGQGILNICKGLSALGSAPPEIVAILQQADAPAQISQLALEHQSSFASDVMEVFTEIFAQQCANLALLFLPTNGVYIAGGIAPKIQTLMASEHFRNAYFNKDNMNALLTKFPVYLITNPSIGILGAAVAASRH